VHRLLFDYDLPAHAIAQKPIMPRDSARLLDARSLTDYSFSDLPNLLRPNDVVVVNNTRVRAARLIGRKETGGAVELLLLDRQDEDWTALIRPARRVRAGLVVRFGDDMATITSDPVDGVVSVRFARDGDEVAAQRGQVPLPPYIHFALEDPNRYQTVYAGPVGSAAAPTAGLHITSGVLSALVAKDVAIVETELRVGLDTFRPIATENIEDHEMHSEWRAVPQETVDVIRRARSQGGRVIAIGTTVVRTLESAVIDGALSAVHGPTDIFIRPGHTFQVVDCLVTNFHVPGSTLLVMISSMLPNWRQTYAHALEHGYRFLSFGDAMFIEVEK